VVAQVVPRRETFVVAHALRRFSGAYVMTAASRPNRRTIRLKEYDYAQPGAYFVTICTQDRACLFGDVMDCTMKLNAVGRLVATLWNEVPARFANVDLNMFVVMPNHIHGILLYPDDGPVMADRTRATTRVAPTIGQVVGAFKSLSTVEYVRNARANGWPAFRSRLWQRNYYEHVIRDEADLDRIRRYIDENPARWEFDDENPQRVDRSASSTL
jgi:putative transposase